MLSMKTWKVLCYNVTFSVEQAYIKSSFTTGTHFNGKNKVKLTKQAAFNNLQNFLQCFAMERQSCKKDHLFD